MFISLQYLSLLRHQDAQRFRLFWTVQFITTRFGHIVDLVCLLQILFKKCFPMYLHDKLPYDSLSSKMQRNSEYSFIPKKYLLIFISFKVNTNVAILQVQAQTIDFLLILNGSTLFSSNKSSKRSVPFSTK